VRRIDNRKENEIYQQKRQLEFQKLQESRDSLFGVIGHELKNPLSAIINTANLLEEHHYKMDDNTMSKNLREISYSAFHLYKLFDNLLQ